jgi:uncharacterized protein (TIGR02271 family)
MPPPDWPANCMRRHAVDMRVIGKLQMSRLSESNAAPGPGSPRAGDRIIDAEGREARIMSTPESAVVLRIENGPELTVSSDLLASRGEGAYRLPFTFESVMNSAGAREKIVIPVVQEELRVGTRTVETGTGVRVHKTVTEREQIVDQPLLKEELVVEHIPVGTMVDPGRQPAIRYEGDTLVVPVLEEVLVVEKQLRLKEEVHITRRQREVRAPQKVSLKAEQVSVEHFDESDAASERSGIPKGSTLTESEPRESTGKART